MSRAVSVVADNTSSDPEVLVWPPKGPDEVLDYSIDWSNRLDEGDSVTSATWTYAFTGIVTGQSFTGTTTTVWLENGELDKTYVLSCEVETTNSRTMQQTVNITIRAK